MPPIYTDQSNGVASRSEGESDNGPNEASRWLGARMSAKASASGGAESGKGQRAAGGNNVQQGLSMGLNSRHKTYDTQGKRLGVEAARK